MGHPALEKLFSDLSKIIAIKMQSAPYPQEPGNENSIFLLEKCGERYYLMPSPLFDVTHVRMPNLFDGLFMYAILADHPQQVMVGAPYSNKNVERDQAIEGHASISLRRDALHTDQLHTDVLYAGELEFWRTKLLRWNNQSGHYL